MTVKKKTNITTTKKCLIFIGLLVASLVIADGIRNSPVWSQSVTMNNVFSHEHIKGRAMFLGRLTRQVINYTD